MIHIVNTCIEQINDWAIEYSEIRASGETWGFVGYEICTLPESCSMGHNGAAHGNTEFWIYKITGYHMYDRVGEIENAETVAVFGEIVRNQKTLQTLSDAEKRLGIDERFVHVDEAGRIVFDILVFEGDALSKINRAIRNHRLYATFMRDIQGAFDKIVEILKESSSEILKSVLPYCASMKILDIRMMTVHDEVEAGKLIIPEDPAHSRVAMWLDVQ